ncbi:glycosyltransferase [Pararhodobacter oceanensis]|uniref:Glycosyltransferase n=1 Tax=Pararhodobacter oceanensis TaxID=2172121 RepID=A0A2T8HVD9_9RHOB|nr:glycosyltransferase [Pararhodobacter oceanensis]
MATASPSLDMLSRGPPKPRLAAVVVTHNRLVQLQITLRALLAQPHDDLAGIVVVDNASEDGTAPWLATLEDPRLLLRHSAQNMGGAGGFEMGMRAAMAELAPDWIVVMDDDARPDAGAFAAFHALDLRGFDGFAAAVRDPDGRICDMNMPTFNPFWHKRILLRTLMGGGRNAFHLRPEDFARAGLRCVDGASFVGFFVRASTVRARGYPDPALFLYGDDAIYTMGLTRAGHRIGFDPSVRFEHDCSTFSAEDPRIRPLWKVYYYYRNSLRLYRIAAGVFFGPVMLLYLPKWLWRTRHYGSHRRRFLRLLALALRDGISRHRSTPHARILAIAAGLSGSAAHGDGAATAAALRPRAAAPQPAHIPPRYIAADRPNRTPRGSSRPDGPADYTTGFPAPRRVDHRTERSPPR